MYVTVDVHTKHDSNINSNKTICRIRKTTKHDNLTTFWVHTHVAHVWSEREPLVAQGQVAPSKLLQSNHEQLPLGWYLRTFHCPITAHDDYRG